MRSLAFVFVVDGPGLELQSLLLAATLRQANLGDRIIAYRPLAAQPLSPVTDAVFRTSGIEVAGLPAATPPWAKPYPHGNKILACCAHRDEEITVFLDTDMVASQSFTDSGLPESGTVCLVPEGVPTWGRDGDRWERAYGHFGLPLPKERVRLTRRKRLEFLPYFNAGMVAFRRDDGFAEAWFETAQEIDHRLAIGGKRPWLDQIALPVALVRSGLSYRVLDSAWNFSISDRQFEPEPDPIMVHYHRFRFLADWPQGPAAWQALNRLLPVGTKAEVAERFEAAGFPVRAF